jgi:hypothetical protein
VDGEGEWAEGVLTVGKRGRHGEGVRPTAVMDGGGVKGSVGWQLEARRRDEDNGNGLQRWRLGL